jgi:hypothetical protein
MEIIDWIHPMKECRSTFAGMTQESEGRKFTKIEEFPLM